MNELYSKYSFFVLTRKLTMKQMGRDLLMRDQELLYASKKSFSRHA